MLFHIRCFHLWHFKQTSYWVSLETQTCPPALSLCSVLFFKIKTVKYKNDSIPAYAHSCTNSKKFCISDTLCSLQLCCQHAYTQCTATQYISITIEITVCDLDNDCYDNLTAQELMCLLTFQSNDNFILS